jgi:hypothetical protein
MSGRFETQQQQDSQHTQLQRSDKHYTFKYVKNKQNYNYKPLERRDLLFGASSLASACRFGA